MAVYDAEAISYNNGYRLHWTASYDDVANVAVIQSDLTLNGQPVAPSAGMTGGLEVTLANGQKRRFDCCDPAVVNLGPQTFDHVNLKVDTVGRWSGFYVSGWFTLG